MSVSSHSAKAVHPDQRLIEGLRQNDSQVIEEIYRSYASDIRSYVLANTGSTQQAKDLFQEGLLAVWAQSEDPDFKLYCSFGYYLKVIVQRKWLDQLRKGKVYQRVLDQYKVAQKDVSWDADFEKIEEEQKEMAALNDSFTKLGPRCQDVLTAYKKGWSARKIVEQLGFASENAVHQKKKKCQDRWITLFHQALKA